MELDASRRAIRLLLDDNKPADAMAAYYAYYHDAHRTQLIVDPADAEAGQAAGYVAVSQTGIDLFRPLLTMRLPIADLDRSAALLKKVMPSGTEAFLACPIAYDPLIRALFEIRSEEKLALFALDGRRFTPTINVLVTREDQNNMPRFVIKKPVNGQRQMAAAAGLNWISPRFAEIAVRTGSDFRRQGLGKSVVSALVDHLRKSHRQPLYAVSVVNQPSMQLARGLGFVDSGYRQLMLEVRAR